MDLLELLKQKFAGVQGIRPDTLAQLAIAAALVATTDDEKKSYVEKLTKEQVEAFQKDYRKSVDQEVTNSTKTFETNLRNKYDLVEKGKGGGGEHHDDDPKKELKEMLQEMLKPMQEQINGLTNKNQTDARQAKLNEVLNDCKDEILKSSTLTTFPLMNFSDDAAFDTYIISLKENVGKANKVIAERGLPNTPPTIATSVDENEVSPAMKEYVKEMNGGDNQND
ncbi:MAG: hypothetical protein IKD78_05515 [Bacteroidales bacterium]|nr:hypothetical protein [Bacteroidales bacterium]